MYYEDLTDYSYFLKTPVPTVKNVGWLANDHPFSTGKVSVDSLSKLAKIITSVNEVDFHVNKMRGADACPICGCTDLLLGDVLLGSSEIWITSHQQQLTYAAPSLIYHYIEKHNYCPPKVFLDAVDELDLSQSFNAQETYLESIVGHF